MIINDASVTHSMFCTMVHWLETATSASFSVSHRFDTSNSLYQTLATVMDANGQLVMGIESTQPIAIDGLLMTAVDSFGPSSGSHQIDSSNFLYQTKCGDCEHCGQPLCLFDLFIKHLQL